MIDLCHHFPGFTPMNVWELQFYQWTGFAKAIDQLRAEARKKP